MPDLTPDNELNRVALLALSIGWRCRHCEGRAEFRAHEPIVPGLFPYMVEHTHDLGCPEHEDFGPDGERPDRWDFKNDPFGA